MGALVAILQSDPNLLRCQVRKLDEQVHLAEPGVRPDAYGFGYYRGNDVLLGKRPSGASSVLSLAQLAGDVDSDALVAHARTATVGTQKDENTHPFRYRRWLFAHDGTVEAFAGLKPRLLERLRPFLRRQIEGETDSEHVFKLFLEAMHATGRMDDLDVEAAVVGRALGTVVRELDDLAREAGAVRPSTLDLVATNGRVMAATRRGRPLHYKLLENALPCPREGLDQHTPESDPRLRPHRQARAVCLATLVTPGAGFQEVPEGSVITVERDLGVALAPLA